MKQQKQRETKKSELAFDKAMTTHLYLLVAGLAQSFIDLAKIIVLLHPASGYAVQLMDFDPIVFFLSS